MNKFKVIPRAILIKMAISIVVTLGGGILVFFSWLYLPLLNYESTYYNLYDQGFVIQTNGEEQPKPQYGYHKDKNVEYKQVLVVLNYKDPFYPIIYHLGESQNEADSWDVDQLTLQRTLFGYLVWQRNDGFVRKMSVAEVTNAAQNYKFNEYGKTDSNIEMFDQLTREKVELRKKRAETDKDYASFAEMVYKIGSKELSLGRKLENIETVRQLYKDIETQRAINPALNYHIYGLECTPEKIQTQKGFWIPCMPDVSFKALEEIESRLKNNQLDEEGNLNFLLAAVIWTEHFKKLVYTINEN